VTKIVALARAIVGKLVKIAADNPSAEDIQLLGSIGSMPIVSKDYDPNCMISYTAGLICCMKKEEPEELINWVYQRYNPLNTLQSLIYTGDCIDKDVIMGIIDLGTNHVHGYGSAVAVAGLSSGMLLKGSNAQSSDTRIALAIRAGLIEMCLNFVDRFGGHESFCDEDKSLYNRIESIFYIINDISLHQKTAKAIRSKKIVTEDKLVRLADTITTNDTTANDMSTSIIYNDKCKDLLDIARCILDINGSYCCRCIKQLSKTEVMQCNGCSSMVYCSKECQKEDWLNGHKLTCNKLCTNDNVGQFQGRFQPAILPEEEGDASKLKELETNFNMIQLKLFLDHSGTILSQAKALGIPLCDCIVVFDRRNCPIKIETFKYCHEKFFGLTDNGCFKSVEEREGFEASRSKENITCVYVSRMIIGDDIKDEDKPVLFMQRLFPHDWLKKGGTSSARGAAAKPSPSWREKAQPAFRMADLYVADTNKASDMDRFTLGDLDVSGIAFEHIAAADSAEE